MDSIRICDPGGVLQLNISAASVSIMGYLDDVVSAKVGNSGNKAVGTHAAILFLHVSHTH